MNDPQPEGHMASYIGRRKFLATLLGGAAAWPLAARAQQRERMRRIGVLMHVAAEDPEGQRRVAAFLQGLQEAGWGVGRATHVTSTIVSEGALLSASMRRAKNATGGLLRKIGDRGILVIKDVTSILSSDRNIRGAVLAAIREIYDGRWERNVISRFGLRLGCSRPAGVGNTTVSAVPSMMTLASSPARAASIPLTYSIAAADEAQQPALNNEAEHEADAHGDEHHHQESARDGPALLEIDADRARRAEGAECIERAVRDVEDFHHPEDQGKPDRDDEQVGRIDEAIRSGWQRRSA